MNSEDNRKVSMRNNIPAKTFFLEGESFQKGVACTWQGGNKFCIYSRSQTTNNSNNATSFPGKILNIRQDVMLFNCHMRKLVNESNGTFVTLQKAAEAAKSSENQIELLKVSRQFRAIIHGCIENLRDAESKATDGVEKNDLLSYITIFYSIECIWHLCEILFIDNVPGDVVLPFLLEWVRFHFPCHETIAAQLLEACEHGSEDHPEYWNTVVGMVIQGRVDVTRALLKLHTDSDSNEFNIIDNVLKTMPVYSVYSGVSSGEFGISWKHWQAECRDHLKHNNRSLLSHPNLELIMRLIIGDYTAFESIQDNFDSWYDLLGGWLLYNEPWARRHELAAHAHACAGLRGGQSGKRQLESILLAVCELDLHQVIHDIQHFSDNGWFATHLTDLLYHCDKLKILDKHQTNVTSNLRQSLIMEYGSILMEHKSLWPVGLSYLMSCPPEGMHRAELIIERIPLTSELQAMRIISESNKYNLHNVVRCVCECMGARYLSWGRAGSALAWAARGKCATLATRASDVLLREYVQTGRLQCADLLLTLGTTMLLSDRLVFLGKYCDFHRLYKNGDFINAGNLLISLITSKLAPDYFWEILLLDTLPLLESDQVIFSSSDTFELMVCVEQQSTRLASERGAMLRLALARNLARACLSPMDVEGD